jgi:P4 family phage/plasmid primase-like protien
MDFLKAALSYFEAGQPVIAVQRDKTPYRDGWNEYLSRPQTEAEVKEHFANGVWGIARVLYPACENVVLDFDGEHAEEAWRKTNIKLPKTARISTPSGGFHLVFKASAFLKASDPKRKVRIVEADCECRKDGKPRPCGVDFLIRGYSLIPPSPGYREDPGFPIESSVELPQKVVELAMGKRGRSKGNGNGKIHAGKRNATLTSIAGVWRREGMEYDEILERLLQKNRDRCDPPLDEREVEQIARSISRYEPAESIEAVQNLTDLGNAKRFEAMHGGNVLYSAERGKWIFWNQRFWEWDITGAVLDLAQKTIRGIYTEASKAEDKTTRSELAAHAAKSESRGKIDAMLALAERLPAIRTTLERFDRHPFLFNCANGTLELKAGELRSFRREDYLTKISPTVFDPDATCPRFLNFLDTVTMGKKDLAQYLQRFAGYSLTGSIQEQCLLMLLGIGGNGKTTFIETLIGSVGPDYAKQVKTEIFFESKSETRDYHIADLAGARLVAACEGGKRRTLAAAFVKQATGGEQLVGRRPYEMPFSFWPQFKLWFSTNHQPRVDDTSEGMWRRLHPVPFKAVFDERRRIKGYEQILLQEAPGIFRWLLEGCLKWQQKGLLPSEDVRAKAKEYREQEDVVGNFILEKCDKGPDKWVAAGALYEAYTDWCEENGERPENTTTFGRTLSEMGFYPDRINDLRVRKGLCLK